MSKALFKYYKDRIARCQSPAELLEISNEIKTADLRNDQKGSLALAAIFAAKWFDKKGYKLNEDSQMECPGEM